MPSLLLFTDDVDEGGVRAPIPQRQEQLVGPGYEGYQVHLSHNRHARNARSRVRTVFDGFRNFGAEGASAEGGLPVNTGKRAALEELFKPPLDLMFKGDFQSARDAAEGAKKWLLVNVQVKFCVYHLIRGFVIYCFIRNSFTGCW